MSYTIVYDRQFIKLSDERIIPMILCGSNNCWEQKWGRWRRDRSWQTYWHNSGKSAFTVEELMERAKECTGDPEYTHFMRNGKWVYDDDFLRFFQNGIKEAKTIQELRELKIHTPAIRAQLTVWKTVPGSPGERTTELSVYIHSDEEVISLLKQADERMRSKADNEEIYVFLEFYGDCPLPKVQRIRTPKARMETNFFVVTINGKFVTKLTKRNLHYAAYSGYAKQFETARAAEKWIEQYDLHKRFDGKIEVQMVA